MLIDWLNKIPLAGLMLVVALGFSLGRLSFRGLTLGPAGGTILVALLLGRGGLTLQDTLYAPGAFSIGDFGFALFIYSVGFEAGPRFFASLRGGVGWRFVLVGAVVNVTALGVALVVGRVLDLGGAITAGTLAGALTSPPTFAAAEVVSQDAADLAELAVSFALTYPIGLAAVVLMVQFVPRLLGDDLRADLGDEEDGEAEARAGRDLTRAFEVRHAAVIGPTLRELALTRRTGCFILRVHRGEEILAAGADTKLAAGDHVLARGRLEELQAFEALVGPEVYDEELRRRMRRPRKVRVTHRSAHGKTLAELAFPSRLRAMILSVDRGGHELETSAELSLQRGDIVIVGGKREALQAVAKELGRFERSTSETDVAVYAGGILLGLLLGRIEVPLFGADLTLGMAGGLLLAGVLLGRFRNLGLIHAHVPRAARQLVRDLGILLFVAERGIYAGESSAGTMEGHLLPVLASSLVIVFVSVLVAALVAKHVLKLRPVDAWGSIGGGMTSSSALVAVKRASDSREPALSYAASYAVASVLATIAGQVIIHLMR